MTVAEAEEDVATALLWEGGTHGIEVQPRPLGRVDLLAYFTARPALKADLRSALAALPGVRIEPAHVPEVDWVERFREGFRPFTVSGFVVAPPWRIPAPSDGQRRLLVIDPGRAFGTGTHETTRLCLVCLEELAAGGPLGRTLDLGAGTGILAVAASVLGAQPVVALDVDPEAIESVRQHARLNRAPLFLVRGDGARALARRAFDLVLANLTAGLLCARREEIAGLCAPSGTLVLSGFLADDLPTIRDAYASAGSPETRVDGEWAALIVRGEPSRP